MSRRAHWVGQKRVLVSVCLKWGCNNQGSKGTLAVLPGNGPFPAFFEGLKGNLGLSEAFYADAMRRVNLLTLAFALYFPAFERLRSTRSLA